MGFMEIFAEKSKHLSWERIANDHVIDGPAPAAFVKGEAYYLLRLKEMYLRTARKLWRKLYPMLHAYAKRGAFEENTVAGPGQLRALGEGNLDRIVNLNQLLAGPTPFTGEEVEILIGLFSVPSADATKALIDTVATIANLGGLAVGAAAQIAVAVKTGVEKVVGLDEAQLQLGVRDRFYANDPMRAGFYLGVAAPLTPPETARLWLRKGRLVEGADPIAATPYETNDYFVIEVEHSTTREDWPGLPGIAPHTDAFRAILSDPVLDLKSKRQRLGPAWVPFREALEATAELTVKDRARIASDVEQDLKRRLDAMENGNPFETKDLSGKPTKIRPEAFELMDVPTYAGPAATGKFD